MSLRRIQVVFLQSINFKERERESERVVVLVEEEGFLFFMTINIVASTKLEPR